MIRPAKPQDLDAIVSLAIESVSQNPLPVVIDKDAMKETALSCLAPSHFAMVSEVDGEVVASVIACVQPSFWHQRSQASVLLYYTRTPGEGIKLLRELARWVKSRPAIKVCIIEFEPEVDSRLIEFMRRLGFTRQSTNLCLVRGM